MMDASISVESRETHEISSDADVVRVRQLARALAVTAQLSLVAQTKLVTAVSELARNTLVYGGGGTAEVEVVTDGRQTRGPGRVHRHGTGHRRHPTRADRWLEQWHRDGARAARRKTPRRRLRPAVEPRRGNDRERRQVVTMTSREPSGADTLWAEDVAWMRVEDDTGPGTVRRRVVELAGQMGLDETRSGHVAIVATELATNLVKHAREGVIVLRALRRGGLGGVEIIALDHGPGMRDVRAFFGDGISTTGTLGIGLGAVRRLSSRYDVHSVPGRGTVVTASFWQGSPGAEEMTAGLTRTLAGESECGDAYAVRRTLDDGAAAVGRRARARPARGPRGDRGHAHLS